ncbi:MAG: hypothetical protein R6V33_04875 [Pelovirga sp.]
MLYLPQGKPVRQPVNPARINLPEAMGKLRGSKFTGYLRFDAEQGAGVVLFQSGKLISTFFISSNKGSKQIAYDAIARIFEISIQGHARLNIYQLSADLVAGIHVLLQGRYLHQGEDLTQFDVAGMLEQITSEMLSVCVRVYAGEKVALIFFDSGYALGFFHDGATELQPGADLEASVAALPGARLDLVEIQSPDQIVLADLMGSADLGPIWQRARRELLEERRHAEEGAVVAQKSG